MRRLLPVTALFFLASLAGVEPALAAWVWPLEGDVITTYRNGADPYAAGQHRGIDIAAAIGAPVVAAAGGEVRFAGTAGSNGLTVSVRTDDGFDTSYLHLGSSEVRPGERVSAGRRLGVVGTSGVRSAAAPHLHFGVREAGSRHGYRDPLSLLPPPGAPAPDAPAAAPEPVPVAPVVAPVPVPRALPSPGRVPAGRRVPAPRRIPATPPQPVARRAPARRRIPAARPSPARREAPAASPGPVLSPEPAAQRSGAAEPGRARAGHPARAHSPAGARSAQARGRARPRAGACRACAAGRPHGAGCRPRACAGPVLARRLGGHRPRLGSRVRGRAACGRDRRPRRRRT